MRANFYRPNQLSAAGGKVSDYKRDFFCSPAISGPVVFGQCEVALLPLSFLCLTKCEYVPKCFAGS